MPDTPQIFVIIQDGKFAALETSDPMLRSTQVVLVHRDNPESPAKTTVTTIQRLSDATKTIADQTVGLRYSSSDLDELRDTIATQIYEAYDFGPDIQVHDQNGWSNDGHGEFTRTVYVGIADSDDEISVNFVVRFKLDSAILDEAYANLPSGTEIGVPAKLSDELVGKLSDLATGYNFGFQKVASGPWHASCEGAATKVFRLANERQEFFEVILRVTFYESTNTIKTMQAYSAAQVPFGKSPLSAS